MIAQVDARGEMLKVSGFKYVASTVLEPNKRITGGEYTTEAYFAGVPPNAAITLRELVRVLIYIKQRSNVGHSVTLACSENISTRLKNESPNGKARIGEVVIDDVPLHFNELNEYGFPKLIPASDLPEWNAAKHEVCFLIFEDWPKKPWACCPMLTRRLKP